MKKAIITLTLAIVAVFASALTPEQMNDRACQNLVGPVKKVVTTRKNTYYRNKLNPSATLNEIAWWNGTTTMRFNRAGYLLWEIYRDGDSTLYTDRTARQYLMRTGYQCRDSFEMHIDYGKQSRLDTDTSDTSGASIEYTFTPWGLPLTMRECIDASWGYKNIYEKSVGRFPAAAYMYGSDVSFTVVKYRYLAFDSHGNWTKRKVEINTGGGNTYFNDRWELHVTTWNDDGEPRLLFTIKDPLHDPRTKRYYIETIRYTETRTITYY